MTELEIEESKQEYEKFIKELNYREDRIKILENEVESLKGSLSRKDSEMTKLYGVLQGYEFCIKQFARKD